MLLLDPLGLAHRARLNEMVRPDETVPDEAQIAPVAEGSSALLFREANGDLRLIALTAVERVEDVATQRLAVAAGQVRLSIEGESRPVIGLSAVPGEEFVKLLHLTDGRLQVLYAVEDVIDIVRLPAKVEPVAHPGLIGGIALVDDMQLEVIDAHWLFSTLAGVPPEADRPACRLIGQDDPWTRNILAPLVAAAGYRPILVDSDCDDGHDAAISIIVGDGAPAPASLRGQIIRLSDSIGSAGGDADTIYRYDRAALLGRLIAGQKRHVA